MLSGDDEVVRSVCPPPSHVASHREDDDAVVTEPAGEIRAESPPVQVLRIIHVVQKSGGSERIDCSQQLQEVVCCEI